MSLPDLKATVLAKYFSQPNYRGLQLELANEFNLYQGTLSNWINKSKKGPKETIKSRVLKLEQQKKEIEYQKSVIVVISLAILSLTIAAALSLLFFWSLR